MTSVCKEMICGDNYVELTEGCDDGNTIDLDGCSSGCFEETGWSCSGGSFTTISTCLPVCDDNMLLGDEEC